MPECENNDSFQKEILGLKNNFESLNAEVQKLSEEVKTFSEKKGTFDDNAVKIELIRAVARMHVADRMSSSTKQQPSKESKCNCCCVVSIIAIVLSVITLIIFLFGSHQPSVAIQLVTQTMRLLGQ